MARAAARSLRSHVALLILLLVSLLSWLLSSLIGNEATRRLYQEIGRDMAELSLQMVDRLDRDMANRAAYLQVLSSLPILRNPTDPSKIRDLLDLLKEKIPSIAWVGYTDPQGQLLASSNGILEGASIAQRPVYLEGKQQLFIGDVHEAVLLAKLLPNPTGEAMKFVDISLPVYGYSGTLSGVLAAHLSWGWAQEVSRELLAPTEQQRGVEFLILSQDHNVLLGPPELIGQTLNLPGLKYAPQSRGYWAEQVWPDGKNYLTAFAQSHGYQDYAGLGWIVIARQDATQAYEPAQALRQTTILWGVALALLFALIGSLLAGYLTRSLKKIAHAADRLSAGLPAELPENSRTREIATLSHSIRHLVDSLTHQQSANNLLDNQAHSDRLTGLANRAALERFLVSAPLVNQALALLYLDLDGFKPVNDQYGHATGDLLLQQVAQRLRQCVREGDLAVRLGGDEFVLILQVNAQDAAERTRQVAERVLHSLQQPMQIDGHGINVGCSIGAALWPQDGSQLSEVLALADKALYRAKHAGRNRAEFHCSTGI